MPEQIGKYQLTRVIGKGAMGIVYEAFDPHIERAVALKTIRKELLEDDRRDEIVARFKNEARAAGRLAHPNIVAIYDYGEDDDSAFIVMEYVAGTPLAALLQQGQPAELQRARGWMLQILRGLAYAHKKGVTHRDVKPANVLIEPGDGVKVTDFGIARIDQSTLTASGSVIGTPSYMSPEQLRGDPVDGRSDIFSAGIVLYQVLTGVRPFQGSSAEIMQKILNAEPVPPSVIVPALGGAVDGVLARALARDPARRYATAGEFAAELGAALLDDDATRVATRLPPASAPAAAGDETIDWKGLLARPITARLSELTELMGPVATVVVRRALAQATDPASFCAALDQHLPTALGRADIRRAVDDVLGLIRGTAPALTGTIAPRAPSAEPAKTAAPPSLDAVARERALVALIDCIGPVAKLVVAKAARAARDEADFIRLLSEAIPQEAQRAAFLRTMKAGPA
jgi:tRNA A-37 threonylcarbamoyl transferase component Bud32